MAADNDWSKPKAVAIPKEGYFTLQQGRYGPTYPRTPACYGFTIIAKIRPGHRGQERPPGALDNAFARLDPSLQLHFAHDILPRESMKIENVAAKFRTRMKVGVKPCLREA